MAQQVTASPMPPRTAQKLPVATIVYPILKQAARIIIPLLCKLRIEGLENVPTSGGAVLAADHLSWFDIPIVAFPLNRQVRYMAKEELFSSGVGWLIKQLGAFAVKRGESDREALRTASELLTAGELVGIFPEGHRSEDHALIEAHPGVALIAMRANAPVIPIAIWGSEKTLRKGYRLIHRPEVHLRYGKPITLEAAGPRRTGADLKRGTDEVMTQIALMLPEQYRGVYASAASAREQAMAAGAP